jgi:class 3 adenylate cyclase
MTAPGDDPIPFDPDPHQQHGALACGGAVLLVRRTGEVVERTESLTPDEAASLAADLVAAARTARRLGGRAP